jgi:hypothetical protein
MKTSLLALAAAISLAIAAPSLALAHTADHAKTAPVKKVKLVQPKKMKQLAKLNCEKPIIVKGVKQCPVKGAATK